MKGAVIVSCGFLCPLLALGGDAGEAAGYEPGAWSPYLVGALLGLLTCLTLYISDQAVGASSFYAVVAGRIGMLVAPAHTRKLAYFKANPPKWGWETVFVLATVAGGFVSAQSGGEFNNRWVPQMWEDYFGGDSFVSRALAAFGGGVLMAFGARMAGGCTSGHGISGTAQLNVASWIAVICFFLGGVLLASIIYAVGT